MNQNPEQKESEEYQENKASQELTEAAIEQLAQILIMCWKFSKKDKNNHERKSISDK